MDEESEVIKKENSGCLIQLLILLLLIIVLFIGGKILYKRLNEKVVDKQSNNGYTIELVAIDNIKWPFGSCKGRLVLKNKDNKVICRQKIEVNNDGTTIDKSNWKVEWKADRVVVTIKGYDDSEEKIYNLFFSE